MKLIVSRMPFAQALKMAAKIVPNGSAGNQIQSALVEFKGQQLKITSGDGHSSLQSILDGRDFGEGEICLPAEALARFSESTIGDDIRIEEKNQGEGKVAVIMCGKSRYQTPTQPTEDFQVLPIHPLSLAGVDSKELRQAIRAAVFCVEKKSVAVTSGILLRSYKKEGGEYGMEMISTDRRRMARFRFHKWNIMESLDCFEFVLSMASAKKLFDILPERESHVEISCNAVKKSEGEVIKPNSIAFSLDKGHTQFSTSSLDGSFPDLSKFWPKDLQWSFRINRALLSSAIERIGLTESNADPHSTTVAMQFSAVGSPNQNVEGEWNLSLESSSAMGEEVVESIEVRGTTFKEGIVRVTLGFGVDYLREAAAAMDSEFITLSGITAAMPVLVSASEGKHFGKFEHLMLGRDLRAKEKSSAKESSEERTVAQRATKGGA